MRQQTRTLALLLMTLTLVIGCARGAQDQRVGEAPPYVPTVVTVPASAAPAVAVAPIPGHQKAAKVAFVDEPNQIVYLTDGTALKVAPTTQMYRGAAGKKVVLAELRPGDELVIVLAETAPTASAASTGGSALPREVATPARPDDVLHPREFWDLQAP